VRVSSRSVRDAPHNDTLAGLFWAAPLGMRV
jgi:hypothetical protein